MDHLEVSSIYTIFNDILLMVENIYNIGLLIILWANLASN